MSNYVVSPDDVIKLFNQLVELEAPRGSNSATSAKIDKREAEVVSSMIDSFVHTVTEGAAAFAKHRGASAIDPSDIDAVLKRDWAHISPVTDTMLTSIHESKNSDKPRN